MTKVRRIDLSHDEFLAGIGGEMSPEDLGVYWMICLCIYSKRRPIPDDPAALASKFDRKTNPRTVRAALDRLVAKGKVQRSNGELMVERCWEEIGKATNRIRTAAENGSNGGRPPNENSNVGKPAGYSSQNLSSTTTTTSNEQDQSRPATSDPGPARQGEGGGTIGWTNEEINLGKQFIEAFDNARAAAFGEELRRPFPTGKDISTAVGWVRQGAGLPLVTETLAAVHRKLKGLGGEPPRALAFHENDIATALRAGHAPTAGKVVDLGDRKDRVSRIVAATKEAMS